MELGGNVKAVPGRWRSIIFTVLVSWALVTILYITADSTSWHWSWKSPSSSNESRTSTFAYPDYAKRLWHDLRPLLEQHAPTVPPPIVADDARSTRFDGETDFEIKDKIQMSPADVLQMSQAHSSFVESIQANYSVSTKMSPTASRGIVTVAGGFYFPVFMVSLRMLRRTGCTLPVEVFLADRTEYETELCENILPSMNARCLVLSDILDGDGEAHSVTTYQYKIFAILFSSFEEVLFMDADLMALHDPTTLFTSPPFTTTGLITWPDFWTTSISPVYSLITSQEPIDASLRASTESGQLLVSKQTHLHTLLLAAYYNYHGPSHYYKLLCQGGAGRGDKSTFLPAAITMNQTFYDVKQKVLGIGHMEPVERLYIFAMIQHDPIEEYKLRDPALSPRSDGFVAQAPRPLFLHANTPKWNPKNVLDHPGPFDLSWNMAGKEVGAYSDPADSVAKIEGVERRIWTEAEWVGCELEKKFKAWENDTEICSKIREHVLTLEPEPAAS